MSSIERTNIPKTTRALLALQAAELIEGDRDREYGDPAVNMACAAGLKAVVARYAQRKLAPTEKEALDMLLSKISRSVTGKPKADTFVDIIGYAAIYGEQALKNDA